MLYPNCIEINTIAQMDASPNGGGGGGGGALPLISKALLKSSTGIQYKVYSTIVHLMYRKYTMYKCMLIMHMGGR